MMNNNYDIPSRKVLNNTEFWKMVDKYELIKKGKIVGAINLIVKAYKRHKSNDVEQALIDFQLLTNSDKVSSYERNQIKRKLGKENEK